VHDMWTQVRVTVKNKNVFVDNIIMNPEIHHRLTKLAAVRVDSRLSADMLVVRDIAHPGTRNIWAAILSGLTVVGHRYLNDGSGPAVQYSATTARPMTVCMTMAFQMSYPLLCTMISRAAAKPQSRWRVVTHRAPLRKSWLVLATPKQCLSQKSAVSPAMFVRRFTKPLSMTMGECGM